MKSSSRFIFVAALCACTSSAFANGCIAVRSTSNLTIDMDDRHESKAGQTEFTSSYRYLYSDRHFRGKEEEKNRQAEGSDVRNRINTVDFTFSYWINNDWRISASLPYITAHRSSLYEHDRVNRHVMTAEGVGDLRLMAYRTYEGDMDSISGFTWGVGVKLPTGKEDVQDIAYRPTGPEVRYVDQSIQLGDGGTGLIAELQAYTQMFGERTFGFVTLSYLFNPEDTNGVSTNPTRAQSEHSIPDSYQTRFGISSLLSDAWSYDVAIRAEGVPPEDVFGDSNGFRRPGYAIYLEPTVNWRSGAHRLNISVPWAIERNRVQSVSDRMTGGHGDAAFADYLLMTSYSYQW